MAYLSPVVAVFELIQVIIERRRSGSDALWWITFWDIECLALALGLLWLTVRTFHRPFDRVPDRPGRAPVLADVVMVLAGLIGIGSLIGGIGVWVQGTSDFMPMADLGVSACIVAVAVGFVLLAALAASSMSPAATSPAMAPVFRGGDLGPEVLRDPVVGGLPPGPAAGDRPRAGRPGAWPRPRWPSGSRRRSSLSPVAARSGSRRIGREIPT